MSKTTLYYFSATGNSLAVARYLAQKLDVGDPVSVPGSLVNKDPYMDARDAKAIGFVFPVQRATLPEMLRGFIRSLPIDPNCYYFAVSTYSLFGSNEFWDIDEILAERGAMLNYAAGIRMMGNVGLWQPSDTTINRRLDHMKRQIDDIATAVAYHQENYFPRSNKLLGKAVRAFTDMRRKHIVFHIDKHCKHCGICAQVCPAQNIQLPKRGTEVAAPIRSDRCEACLACIHWCPAGAISTSSRLHVSYHNPTVLPEELHAPPTASSTATAAGSTAAGQGAQSSDSAAVAAARRNDANRDPELATMLRDDLLTPVDIEKWLNETQEEATPQPYGNRAHEKSPRTNDPQHYELSRTTMSDAEIQRALAELES